MNLTKKTRKKYQHLVVVDMIYGFIDGNLACCNALNAVAMVVSYINSNPDIKVYYVMDHHPENHCSFSKFGGPWPEHCVIGTREAELHEAFKCLDNESQRPEESNCFYKADDPSSEQYSGYESHTKRGRKLCSVLPKEVTVCGIATEYCVKCTCEDLIANGHKVNVLVDGLGYVDYSEHKKVLAEYEKKGINLV